MNFDLHQSVQHNLWDYVFYLVYLDTLDSQSLTGFEYFVFSKFRTKSTAWLPINSTLFLNNKKKDEEPDKAFDRQQLEDVKTEILTAVDLRFAAMMKQMAVLSMKIDRHLQTPKDTKDHSEKLHSLLSEGREEMVEYDQEEHDIKFINVD
jgi:hypothetical protein